MRYLTNPEDCERIQEALLHGFGIEATLYECQQFWERRSLLWASDWLIIGDDENLVEDIRQHLYLLDQQQ